MVHTVFIIDENTSGYFCAVGKADSITENVKKTCLSSTWCTHNVGCSSRQRKTWVIFQDLEGDSLLKELSFIRRVLHIDGKIHVFPSQFDRPFTLVYRGSDSLIVFFLIHWSFNPDLSYLYFLNLIHFYSEVFLEVFVWHQGCDILLIECVIGCQGLTIILGINLAHFDTVSVGIRQKFSPS